MTEGGTSDGELLTVEAFLALCRLAKLYRDDLEDMTVGMCLDHIYEYTESWKPKKPQPRRATQADFDAF